MTYSDGQGEISYWKFTDSDGSLRYFKWNRLSNQIWQAVLKVGSKKGRGNQYGVYRIAESSFVASYYWLYEKSSMVEKGFKRHKKLESSFKKEFEHAVHKLMRVLESDFVT